MNNFQYLHTYMNMAQNSHVSPLQCPNCSVVYAVKRDPRNDDDPMLHCYVCRTDVRLGLRTYTDIRNVVDEILAEWNESDKQI